MIACVILAAGASRRLGQPKQLVVLDGETLVHRAARTALEAGLEPVVVVVRDRATREALGSLNVIPVDNPDADRGMGSSIARGIAAVRDARGAIVMTVDQPFVTSAHLEALCAETRVTTATAYADTIGVPAYFPAERFDALSRLTDGAKPLLADARTVPLEAAAFDLDTPNNLEQLRAFRTRQ